MILDTLCGRLKKAAFKVTPTQACLHVPLTSKPCTALHRRFYVHAWHAPLAEPSVQGLPATALAHSLTHSINQSTGPRAHLVINSIPYEVGQRRQRGSHQRQRQPQPAGDAQHRIGLDVVPALLDQHDGGYVVRRATTPAEATAHGIRYMCVQHSTRGCFGECAIARQGRAVPESAAQGVCCH